MAEDANELGFEEEDAQNQLTSLEVIGVVVQSHSDKSRYRHHPVNATLESLVEQLATGYSKQRVPILAGILAEHPDRIRLFTENPNQE